jgi:hypothetical protein
MPPSASFPEIHFAFRPRPIAEAERIARFAYGRLDPKYPLAIVAYAVHDGVMITGFQGDLFGADVSAQCTNGTGSAKLK